MQISCQLIGHGKEFLTVVQIGLGGLGWMSFAIETSESATESDLQTT